MGRILVFDSRNLRGETRKEEKHRILHERKKAILKGESREEVRKIGGWRAGLFGFRTSEIKHMDYCPFCRKRTEHIKYSNIKMCKICSYQEKY